jgi:tRNA-splicing ligase RtcB
MISEIKGKKVNAKLWVPAHEVESSALDQIRNVASLDPVVGVSIMADCHTGSSCTIGSVIAMKDAISPNLVGVDISCGMTAIKTSLEGSAIREKVLRKIHDGIRDRIPVGFNSHDSIHKMVRGYSGWETFKDLTPAVHEFKDRAMHQLGTLGGGNHFIELSVDKDDRVWIMLHSGSRHIGLQIANAHVAIAKNLDHNKQGLPDKGLAYFIKGTKEYDQYMHDLMWAQHYAKINRRRMMTLVQGWLEHLYPSIEFGHVISCHHNYAAKEVHDGEELIITRKGAIEARSGQLGIVPGAMGAKSYIVEGKGDKDSYCSSPHGAGRRMSRSKAKKKYRLQDLEETMNGIVCSVNKSTVDEIKFSYKSIDKVMEYSKDLVEPVYELKQIMNIKG